MLIGVPKEIKNHEYRVGMTPQSAREAVRHGHRVLVRPRRASGSAPPMRNMSRREPRWSTRRRRSSPRPT